MEEWKRAEEERTQKEGEVRKQLELEQQSQSETERRGEAGETEEDPVAVVEQKKMGEGPVT